MPAGNRPNGCRSHSRDKRSVPRIVSKLKKLEQRMWRRECLEARRVAGKITDKNQKEISDLITLT